MTLMQIGETAGKLSLEFTKQNCDIDWTSAIGFRNIVAHKYEHLDYGMIWEIMTEDVPKLMAVCEKIKAKKVKA